MASTRVKRVKSRDAMDEAVDDLITQGYRVVTQGDRSTMLQQATWGSAVGHLMWALFTGWWSCGLGNLGYAIYAHMDAPKVLVKLADGKGGRSDDDDDDDDD